MESCPVHLVCHWKTWISAWQRSLWNKRSNDCGSKLLRFHWFEAWTKSLTQHKVFLKASSFSGPVNAKPTRPRTEKTLLGMITSILVCGTHNSGAHLEITSCFCAFPFGKTQCYQLFGLKISLCMKCRNPCFPDYWRCLDNRGSCHAKCSRQSVSSLWWPRKKPCVDGEASLLRSSGAAS